MKWGETYRKIRFEEGLCFYPNCKNRRLQDNKVCKDCFTNIKRKNKESREKRVNKLSALGLCTRCGVEKYLPSYSNRPTKTRRCQICYLKTVSFRHFDCEDYYIDLLHKLQKQDFKCAYTGDYLILGINDSLDHIFPKKKFPEKAKSLDNIQWVTRDINRMKSSFEETLFIELARKIANWVSDTKGL
jgi:hypothetical protein